MRPTTQPRALLSVFDKQDLIPFAIRLSELGFELVSTGNTHRTLTDAGLKVETVANVTGFPEILDGRVKTLHPRVHGGILAKRSEAHLKTLAEHDITPISLVVGNLYPSRETVAKPGVSEAEVLENIDIGGPSMIRAAAKNFKHVLVVVDPADYARVAEALQDGILEQEVGAELRRDLARKAFAHTAAYDAAIVNWFDHEVTLPDTLHLSLERAETLRYGENPHQTGARYRDAGAHGVWDRAEQHKGVALSYLNLFDAEAAWRLVHEFATPAAVVVKHANPCGVALADTLPEAYQRAYECDPKSAFGGVVALNREVDRSTAEHIMNNAKADVVVAPGYAPAALAHLLSKRKAMRVLSLPAPGEPGVELRRVDGGFLVQPPDRIVLDRSTWQVVTKAQPSEAQWLDLEVAWTVCAHTKSNAIVLVKDAAAVGVGAGQQSRVDAGESAARKAAGRAAGGACASDAFYPFRDGLDAAAAAGVATVIQPGGSVRDDEVIGAADEHGLAMVFTGRRHFRH
ncbi:bifunctional phosphoribosylaminoimidazolecarboxamide formyltransferase/IMP cyclohydrolase [soil metagenome]